MIIDIRDSNEFKRKPTKALNVPEHVLRKDFHFLTEANDIVIICTTGLKAMKMSWYLDRFGIKATHNTLTKYL
jgi:rhodanese-related sulfurtransferase